MQTHTQPNKYIQSNLFDVTTIEYRVETSRAEELDRFEGANPNAFQQKPHMIFECTSIVMRAK